MRDLRSSDSSQNAVDALAAGIIPCTCKVWGANPEVIKGARTVLQKFLAEHGFHFSWIGLSAFNFYECDGVTRGAWMIDVKVSDQEKSQEGVDINALATLLKAEVEDTNPHMCRLKIVCDHIHPLVE